MDTLRRRQAYLDRRTNGEFREALSAWSESDTMRLPTREYLRHQLDLELEVLIRALGPWSEVDPEEIFPGGIWFD